MVFRVREAGARPRGAHEPGHSSLALARITLLPRCSRFDHDPFISLAQNRISVPVNIRHAIYFLLISR